MVHGALDGTAAAGPLVRPSTNKCLGSTPTVSLIGSRSADAPTIDSSKREAMGVGANIFVKTMHNNQPKGECGAESVSQVQVLRLYKPPLSKAQTE